MFIFNRLRKRPEFRVDFNDGPCVEIINRAAAHQILMFDGEEVIHNATIEGKHWTRAHQKYFTNWKLEAYQSSGEKIFEHRFDLTNQNIRINIDSKSLGDSLAWLPQVQTFAQRHATSRVYVSQFWPDLFDQSAYPELIFIDPASTVENCYATYNIGYYFDHIPWHHPADPRTQPLGKIACDILGLPYSEKRPLLAAPEKNNHIVQKPYICIATASTAKCKHWLYPDGWQIIIDHLRQMNFDVMVIQKEETSLQQINDQSGEQSLGDRISQLKHCEFFIGLGSGLSWLAWAVGKPVVLIAGFSEPYTEFESDCYRAFNPEACHGCWNDTRYSFERGDWNWCPRHKGSERQFECSKLIDPDRVKAAIQKLLDNRH